VHRPTGRDAATRDRDGIFRVRQHAPGAGRILLCRLSAPRCRDAVEGAKGETTMNRLRDESGRIGYLVLYMMGVPIGLLLLLWVILGDNIFTAG
jgi:hypothetical protein